MFRHGQNIVNPANEIDKVCDCISFGFPTFVIKWLSKLKMDIESIKRIITDWASKEPLVKKVYIFGSRATNDYGEDSDIDVAVEIHRLPGEESITAAWMDVVKGYREQLSKLLPYPLHLHSLDGDSPIILDGTYRNGILVYEEPKD